MAVFAIFPYLFSCILLFFSQTLHDFFKKIETLLFYGVSDTALLMTFLFRGVVFIKPVKTAAYFFASVGILYKAFLRASGVNLGYLNHHPHYWGSLLILHFFSLFCRRPCLLTLSFSIIRRFFCDSN